MWRDARKVKAQCAAPYCTVQYCTHVPIVSEYHSEVPYNNAEN